MLWKRFRKFLIIVLSIGLVFFGLILTDLKLSRGAVLSLINNVRDGNFKTVNECDPNVVYEITPLEKGNYHFQFENNAFTPKYFTAYREMGYQIEISDTTFFDYANWTQLIFPDTTIGYAENWGCGTGLAPISINPFEMFEMEITYEALVDKSFWRFPFNYYADSLRDPIYNIPILKDSNELWTQIDAETTPIPARDSIKVHYYLFLKSIVNNERYMVKSNGIQLNYLDLINAWLSHQREEQIRYAEYD